MTEHDHINTEDNHTQNDRSANQRRSIADPTEGEFLSPESVREPMASGESPAPLVLLGSVGNCRCYLAVRRKHITQQEQHSSPVSNGIERAITGQPDTN
ncbi:hypothetical protein SAMN05216564_11436 [Halopenitus persicus]|uniref:Uncharacterized protein n=1 Tax=Halopenitus persicus TaxID=1048396 RepID=A0A1H3NQI7_9EURY|nr:hypothetical protein SAMN05216564_11436 [Halopenitus persicus]